MKPPSRSFDVAVVGLGAMGAAAFYQLAKRGIRVVGIDRFVPPHDQGSTHGETRITRQGIGEGEAYVPFALRAHDIWRELEAETGESLLIQCGCLVIAPQSEGRDNGLRKGFLKRTCDTAERFGIPHEIIDPAEIHARYPQFSPREDEIGYFEPGGGYVRPEACISAQLKRGLELGGVTRLGTTVRNIDQMESGVAIATDDETIYAEHVIVAAGAWAPALLGGPFQPLLTPRRQFMNWFPVEAQFAPAWESGPVFIWAHGAGAEDFFYGFPSLPGSGTIKTAGEQYRDRVEPETMKRVVDAEESRAMYAEHVAGRLNGLDPVAARAVTCLYTVTPDSAFVIDRHPDAERILVLSPCSGHGFKHSAAIGETAAQLIAEGQTDIDLSPFAIARFAANADALT